MTPTLKKLLAILFFVSGFCGLLYQVVWVRISFASFGVITPVLSVVISVFMSGLFVGTWSSGKWIGKITRATRISPVFFYAASELMIAVGAFAVPYLFAWGERALLPVGAADSTAYLFWSSLIIAGSIFPWCVFMGATLPLMMAFVKDRARNNHQTSFSFLYVVNVIGALFGTLTTAVVLVELLGFKNTLNLAALLNISVACAAFFLGLKSPFSNSVPEKTNGVVMRKISPLIAILFTTGFTSMAMEVVWTRAFTVVLRTQVYSFAALLFVYLLATWIGSLVYRKHSASTKVLSTAQLLALLAVASLLPVVINDPRLQLKAAGALLSIFPFCALLGYLTPKLIDEFSLGNPDGAGFSYGANIFGCILGPLVASYFLLPALGLKFSLLLLAAPYIILFFLPSPYPRNSATDAPGAASSASGLPQGERVIKWRYGIATIALLFLSVTLVKTYEDQWKDYRKEKGVVRRDHTATVISYGEGMQKRLLVNGIGITHLTTITKVMAHLPLSFLKSEPTSALVICFGMGTTFRSLLSWDIDTTAVELVPSVKEAFSYYFPDAPELMQKPNVQIVVDDGRRFLRRTEKTFDLITLDPPPPVEAAGSSLLYSEEFYAAAKSRLKPGGILQQWVPPAETKIVQAVLKSLLNSFPHVKMFHSYENWGYHFMASMTPLESKGVEGMIAKMPAKAQGDLLEWVEKKDIKEFVEKILDKEMDPRTFLANATQRVTDDRPYNEYYLLRRIWGKVFSSRPLWTKK